MILIDTDVWIEFFKQTPEYVVEISPMLEQKLVVTMQPIFAEILYGVRTKKDKVRVEMYWNFMPKIELDEYYMISAANFANQNNFHNLGIGLTDAIIVKAAIENSLRIWTLDKKITRNIDKKYIYRWYYPDFSGYF